MQHCKEAYLDSRILGNDTSSTARGIKQDPVHRLLSQDLWKLSAIVVTHHSVADSHALQIGLDRLQPLLVDLVGKDAARVAHECSHICGFATCKQQSKQVDTTLSRMWTASSKTRSNSSMSDYTRREATWRVQFALHWSSAGKCCSHTP